MYSLAIKVEPNKSVHAFQGQDPAGQFLEFHIAVTPKVPLKDVPPDLRHAGRVPHL